MTVFELPDEPDVQRRGANALPECDNAGVGVSVQCPLCGSTARCIPRRALDRVMNALWRLGDFAARMQCAAGKVMSE